MQGSDWVELEDDQGRVYYHNERTNKTQWDPPEDEIWQRFETDDGVPYWYNCLTKHSVWKKPKGPNEPESWGERHKSGGERRKFSGEQDHGRWRGGSQTPSDRCVLLCVCMCMCVCVYVCV